MEIKFDPAIIFLAKVISLYYILAMGASAANLFFQVRNYFQVKDASQRIGKFLMDREEK